MKGLDMVDYTYRFITLIVSLVKTTM